MSKANNVLLRKKKLHTPARRALEDRLAKRYQVRTVSELGTHKTHRASLDEALEDASLFLIVLGQDGDIYDTLTDVLYAGSDYWQMVYDYARQHIDLFHPWSANMVENAIKASQKHVAKMYYHETI